MILQKTKERKKHKADTREIPQDAFDMSLVHFMNKRESEKARVIPRLTSPPQTENAAAHGTQSPFQRRTLSYNVDRKLLCQDQSDFTVNAHLHIPSSTDVQNAFRILSSRQL